jgi:large subunit ribosomal protein L9
MKVILLKSHKDLGSKGEVVDVKKGFAVNYLIPNDVAEAATKEAVRRADARRKERKQEEEAAKSRITNLASEISGKTYRISAEVSSGGRVYGSLSKDEVLKRLKKSWKIGSEDAISIDIDLAKPIRQVGKYPVDVTIRAGEKRDKEGIILEVVSE